MTTYCKAVLYKSIGGSYIDISGQMQGPKLKYVENYGVTGSLKIINDMDVASNNLLSASCSMWSSGTGAIKPGMFLQIYKASIGSANQIGVFIITDLSVSDDIISITFGDAIQILRATGCEYVRNHCLGGGYGWHAVKGGYSNSQLYILKDRDVTIYGGDYGDVMWRQNVSTASASGSDEIKTRTGGDYLEFTIPEKGQFVRQLSFSYCKRPTGSGGTGSLNINIKITVGGTEVYNESQYVTWTALQERTFSLLGSNVNPRTSGQVKVRLTINSQYEAWIVLKVGTAPDSSYSIYEDGTTTTGKCAVGTFEYCEDTYNVTGEEDADDPTHWNISDLNGATTFDSGYLSPNADWEDRAALQYLSPGAVIPLSTIFSNIVRAAGYTPSTVSTSRNVGMFRCNGDYYHNYLLALADMTQDNSSRQYAMAASRTSWGAIALGYRYQASDTSVATLYYAGDSSPSSGAIPMMKFTPSMTMKYRPYMAVAKGTKDNGTPIFVTIRDPTVSIGSCANSVDGSITEVDDAALSAYSNIITNRSKDWEGQIVLSGVYTQFMLDSGNYIGGVPVRIYDSRYGMSGYQARVKEVEIDITNQKTILTLNNYSEVYSNSIIDSSKMAYSAGEMSVEASSKDMFVRQYVFLDQSTTSLPSSTTVSVVVDGTTVSADSSNVDIIRFPELNVALVSAYFDKGQGVATSQYAVTYVIVGGNAIQIPQYRRPDKYRTQSLIVNVLYKIP